jgi:ABC-type glycerol-3-phosphate transport system permease component
MLVSSLRPQQELFTLPPRLLPGSLAIEWYEVVLKTTRMPRYLLNSAAVVHSSNAMVASVFRSRASRTSPVSPSARS